MDKPHPIELNFFVSRVQRSNPVTFIRYGDGEFNAILGKAGHNCDQHEYFPVLGQELALTLMSPRTGNYLYSIGPKAARVMHNEVESWVDRYAPEIFWNDSEVFLKASLDGKLGTLLQALTDRRVAIVGAAHLGGLSAAAGWERVQVPEVNAWLQKKAVKQQMQRVLAEAEVLLLCAGMLSKVLAWELFPEYGTRVTLLDMGSVFDMYCGKDSRSYARRMEPARKAVLLEMNFGALPWGCRFLHA